MDYVPALQGVVVVAAAGGIGLAAIQLQCNAASKCLAEKTCTSNGFCSFQNSVGITTDAKYTDYSYNMSRYEELTRGVCAPGERLHVNFVTGADECAPWRAWPDALNHEIMGSGTSKHMQLCGSWIEAGPTFPTYNSYWSFYDGARTDAAIRASEAASFSSSRLSSTDLGKLYASCHHTILGGSGAIRESAVQAYRYILTGVSSLVNLNGTSTRRQVLSAAGFLAGHHCDGPAQIGVGTPLFGSFAAIVTAGTTFEAGALFDALQSVDPSAALTALMAESANAYINANSASATTATFSDLEHFLEGSARRTDHATVPLIHESTPELNGLLWLVDQGRLTEANSYLQGVAAFCAFSIHSTMTLDGAGDYVEATNQVRRIRHQRPKAAALGRLKKHSQDPAELHVTNKSLTKASSLTFSSIRLNPTGDATSDCVAFAEWLFPDRLDRQYFDATVPPKLYSRFEAISEQLRASVEHVVLYDSKISSTLVDPSRVATEVRNTRIRVAGAPRGSWGGIARGYTDAGLSSRDGPMLGALKQARAIYLDRMDMLFDLPSVCSGPPIYDALTQNAYIYPGLRCTHILLGFLRKPFSDERYDDASLASRGAFFVAHELAHNTLVSSWTSRMNSLLHRYPTNVYSEAIADVIAALAVIHSGLANAKQVCEHNSQMWCARTVPGYTTSSTATHPGPNERGDLLCDTLGDLGFVV